jgi:hypothetical protein
MAEGWIKVHRKLGGWGWSDDPIMVAVWVHLLLDASYEDNVWRGRKIERGQLVLGRKAYAKKCGISEQQLRTALNKLKMTSEITTKSTNRYTVVTITKYELYQMDDRESTSKSTSKSTNKQPTNNQQSTTTKEIKKERNKEGDIRHTSWDHPEAVAHGPYVRLLPSEFDAMVAELGESRTSDLILRLNGYIEQIGEPAARKRYKSHKATMTNWHRADVEKGVYRKKEVPNDGYAQWT